MKKYFCKVAGMNPAPVFVLDPDHGTMWRVPGPSNFYLQLVEELGDPFEVSLQFIADAKKCMLDLTSE